MHLMVIAVVMVFAVTAGAVVAWLARLIIRLGWTRSSLVETQGLNRRAGRESESEHEDNCIAEGAFHCEWNGGFEVRGKSSRQRS